MDLGKDCPLVHRATNRNWQAERMSADDSSHVLASSEHAHLVSVELARLASIKPEHLSASLPHIEGRTVHNVIGHTGWICRYVDLCLAATPDDPPARASVPEPPAGADVFAWFNEARTIIGQRVDSIDPASMHPSWAGPWTSAQWVRRLANEASMHRWDAYAAVGSPEPIDARRSQNSGVVRPLFIHNFCNTCVDIAANWSHD